MTEPQKPTFAELLLQGAREAAAHATGDARMRRSARVTRRQITARDVSLRPPDKLTPERIRRIRDDLGLSQAVFAELLNVSASTVRAWEQGKRVPDGPSLRLLEITDREPEALLAMVSART